MITQNEPRIEHVYLGTSVPVEKVLDAAIEHAAQAGLISTIITSTSSWWLQESREQDTRTVLAAGTTAN